MQDQSPYRSNMNNDQNSGPSAGTGPDPAVNPVPASPVQQPEVTSVPPDVASPPVAPEEPATETQQAPAVDQTPAPAWPAESAPASTTANKSFLDNLKDKVMAVHGKLPAPLQSKQVLIAALAILLISGFIIIRGLAAGPFISIQPESAVLSNNATIGNDTSASGGKFVKLGAAPTTPTEPTPTDPTPTEPTGSATTPNLKIAFQGDSSLNANTQAALSLVKSEGASMLVHMGDMTYSDNPQGFESQFNSILGASFPAISVIGNHDDGSSQISAYQNLFNQRLARTPELKCSGTMVVQYECKFRGLHLVGTAPGLAGTGHEAYLKSKLAADNSIWSVCFWHYNMNLMQVGSKGNDSGWGVFEECRMGGGIAMQGHEHSYHRTKTLTSMTNQIVDPTCSSATSVCVAPGKTFSTVNGAGGTALRNQDRCLPTTPPYGCKGEWAKIYTTDQGAVPGMLFITFNVDGNPKKAKGYFKNINGQIVDDYTITRL